ncbi:sirohydrochlorin chelatase [Streptomyces celluloflavus]
MPQLVLAVHGSADPEAADTIARLAALITGLGGIQPLIGHLDVQRPSLADVLARLSGDGRGRGLEQGLDLGPDEAPYANPYPDPYAAPYAGPERAGRGAVVVPLLLGDGYHRHIDLPATVAAARADGLDCALTAGLSGEVAVAFSLYERLRAAERRAGGKADAIVLASAGSGRPGGTDGAVRAARQLRQLLGGERGPVPVRAAYCSSTGPDAPAVPEMIERLRISGHRRIALATHLLAPGRFTRTLAGTDGAWAVSAPLADHPRLAHLVLRRYTAGRLALAPGLAA